MAQLLLGGWVSGRKEIGGRFAHKFLIKPQVHSSGRFFLSFLFICVIWKYLYESLDGNTCKLAVIITWHNMRPQRRCFLRYDKMVPLQDAASIGNLCPKSIAGGYATY